MSESSGFMITGKWYDRIKFTVQIILPALSTFYITVGALWDFPEVEKVAGTLAAISLLLGAMVGLSARNYNNSPEKYVGDMVVIPQPEGGVLYSLEVGGDLDELENKKEVTFRVVPANSDIS